MTAVIYGVVLLNSGQRTNTSIGGPLIRVNDGSWVSVRRYDWQKCLRVASVDQLHNAEAQISAIHSEDPSFCAWFSPAVILQENDRNHGFAAAIETYFSSVTKQGLVNLHNDSGAA